MRINFGLCFQCIPPDTINLMNMNTSQNNNLPDREKDVDKTLCTTCRELIKPNAKKCNHCGSYQDWRRFLGISSSVLALLVALVSTTSILLPILSDTLQEKDSRIELYFVGIYQRFFSLVATNHGIRAGFVPHAKLILYKNSDEKPVVWDLEPRAEMLIVEGNATKPVMFRLQRHEANIFLLKMAQQGDINKHPLFEKHELLVTVREFSKKEKKRTFLITPEDFKKFVLYVQNMDRS